MYRSNLKLVALPAAELIAIGFLGGSKTLNLGEEEGVGDGTVEKSVGEFI